MNIIKSYSELTKQKKWLVIIGILIGIAAIGDLLDGDKVDKVVAAKPIEKQLTYSEKFDKKYLSSWDGSYSPVEKYLEKNLNDPSSLEIVNTWNNGMNKDSTFYIKTTFRAKNEYNALVLQAIYCNLSFDGDVSDVKIE